MTHLGQRLSALIDGELDAAERERVLVHMAKCGACRDEAAALRTLKRRMHALGEAAAGAALTGRLMGLSDAALGGDMKPQDVWPQSAPPSGLRSPGAGDKPDVRAGRYFLTGSIVVFLAGLGTAAVIAGGEPQARAPAPPVTPSVNVQAIPRDNVVPQSGQLMASLRPQPGGVTRQGRDAARTPRLR